jgi:NitT/TauT family transport system permease protein
VTRLVNKRPGRGQFLFLGLLPFVLVAVVYLIASDARLSVNPNDKLLPSLSSFGDAIERMAFKPNPRSGDYQWWSDTWASLVRLGIGLGIATGLGLIVGIALGLVPYMRAAFQPFVAVLSMIPPLAILPILFIVFGLGEVSKVVLIVFGIAPFMMRDIAIAVGAIPRELVIKAQTLGANSWQIATRVALPLSMPRLVSALRLSLGPAWLFLIAAEAIAATDGLGYRIFLVRRYLAMDVILPYVAWITLLAFVMDVLLAWAARRAFRWSGEGGS